MQGGRTHQRARDQLAETGAIERIQRGLGFGPDRSNGPDPAQRVDGDAAEVSPVPRRRLPTRSATNTGPADRRMQQAEEAAGFKDGGEVKARLIRGPGTATSDSIPAQKPAGTMIMPADSTEQLQDVRLSNGESEFPPEVVQRVGAAALLAMRDATHTPAAAGFKPIPGGTQGLADGGVVGEDERRRNSFGDAAAANLDSRVAQIPTTGYRPAPDGNRVDSTELGRNVGNTLSALPGVAPALGAVRTLAAARGFDAAASGARGAVAGALPYGTPAAGAIGLANASGSSAGAPVQPAAPPSPAAPLAPAGGAAGALSSAVQAAPAGFTPQGQQPSGSNVTRVGNSYSASGPVRGDITINGREAGGGFMSIPSPGGAGAPAAGGAAAQLGGALPQVYRQAPGTDWQSRQDLRNAQTGASSIVNSPARAQAQADVQRLGAVQQLGMRNVGDTDVAGIRAETDRAGQAITAQNNTAAQRLAAGRLGIDAAAAEGQAASRAPVLAAQQAFVSAATPEARSQALATLQGLQGGAPAPRFTVVPGGTDDMGNRQASSVFNNQTGQFVQQGGAQPAAGQRPVGTTSTVNGRTAVWDGSKWVPR